LLKYNNIFALNINFIKLQFKSPLVSPVDSPLLAMLPPELASSSDASQHRRSCYRISHSPLNSPLPFSLPEKESGGGGGGEGVVGKKATLFSVPRDDAQTCAEIAGEQQRREELETEAECERQQPPKEDPHEKGEKLPSSFL
jgi:hypothetical protein